MPAGRAYQPGSSASRGPMPGSRKLDARTITTLLERARAGLRWLHMAREIGIGADTLVNAVDGKYVRAATWDRIMAYTNGGKP